MVRLKKTGNIIPKNSKEVKNSRIGIGFEKLDRDVFDPEKAYDKLAALGLKWVRIQSGWARTEKEKGVYDFAWLDKIVDNLIARGLKPWICLCYGNGIYNENAARIFGAVGVPPIFSEEEKSAWIKYVKALVSRYKNRVTHYEVWNEPDGVWCWKHGPNAKELGVFTAETGKAIHEVFPDAKVIGLVTCLHDIKYMTDAFSGTDLAENIDAVSFHAYITDEVRIPEKVMLLRAICDMNKAGLKIIQGESGSQSKHDGNGALKELLWSEKAQAKQLSRHLIMDLSTEVEFTSYFSCMDMIEALNGNNGEKSSYLDYGYFGVLGAEFDDDGFAVGDYEPKPSYYSLQTISSVFAEDFRVVKNPMIKFTPKWFERYQANDLKFTQIAKAFFERENGGQMFVFWNPENILTTDFVGSISFDLYTKNRDFHLVDFITGEVYELPEEMKEDLGNNCYRFVNIPIKDYPLGLIIGEFCEFE